MIGMDVGLEYPVKLEPVLLHVIDELVGRLSAGAPGGRIVVENRIDDGAYVARRIARNIAHGVGCFIKKTLDLRASGHGLLLQKIRRSRRTIIARQGSKAMVNPP